MNKERMSGFRDSGRWKEANETEPTGPDPDSRYARGEITRDEWLRLKGFASGTPPMPPAQAPPPPPPAPGGRGLLLFIAVVAVVLVVVVAAFLMFPGRTSLSGWNPSYGPTTHMQVSDLGALNASATQAMAFSGNHTLWYPGGSVSLVMLASPPDHDMAFVAQGMANPTIHVPAGTRVTVTMVNMDSGDYHNWALTGTAPPYSSMPMMGSGSMMSMTMMSPASGGMAWSQTLSFTTVSGTYWYVCQYASHAASGMYGSLVVG